MDGGAVGSRWLFGNLLLFSIGGITTAFLLYGDHGDALFTSLAICYTAAAFFLLYRTVRRHGRGWRSRLSLGAYLAGAIVGAWGGSLP